MKARKYMTLILAFGLWSAMVLGCSSFRRAMNEKRAEREGPAVTISAAELFKAYETNEAEADKLYQGKIVIVSGTVGTTSTPEQGMGRAAVVLIDEHDKPIVTCFGFPADARDAIAKLKTGDKVTVKGKCMGRIATDEPTLEDSVLQ